MKILSDRDLCEWLRMNSSGTYRSSAMAADRIEMLLDALQNIANIEDNLEGGDWDEIDEARTIANSALEDFYK